MRTKLLSISVLRVASGPRVKLASFQSASNHPMVYSTERGGGSRVNPNLCCFVLYSKRRFVLCLTLCYLFLCFQSF